MNIFVSSFHRGNIKFEKRNLKPFDKENLSTVVLYAPLFNKMLKDKNINYEATSTYLLVDLVKLQPIMDSYKNKTLAFSCCGCEKSARD